MIYLASPYTALKPDGTHDTELENFRYKEVLRALKKFALLGVAVYSPIAHWHQVELEFPGEISHDQYLETDFGIICRCDRLYILMLDGWQTSKGVTAEINYANSLGMFILYTEV